MPTVLYGYGFRVVINTDDHDPPHVHAVHANGVARIAIGNQNTDPVVLSVRGLSRKELKAAMELVKQFQEALLEAWEEFHV